MIDAGGGAIERFQQAGADLSDLELLAITQLCPNHVIDLPQLLLLSDSARDRPLRLVGPSAVGTLPGIASFVGGDRRASFQIQAVDPMATSGRTPVLVLREAGVEVSAVGVPHGRENVPPKSSLAYRVRLSDKEVVFGGDQNGSHSDFLDFADDADLLVMHLAISERAGPELRDVYAPPSVLGRIARQAEVDRLLLSHIVDPPPDDPNATAFSGPLLQESLREVRFVYSGPIEIASDLQCVPLM